MARMLLEIHIKFMQDRPETNWIFTYVNSIFSLKTMIKFSFTLRKREQVCTLPFRCQQFFFFHFKVHCKINKEQSIILFCDCSRLFQFSIPYLKNTNWSLCGVLLHQKRYLLFTSTRVELKLNNLKTQISIVRYLGFYWPCFVHAVDIYE